MRKSLVVLIVLMVALCASSAFAAPLRVFVGEMNVIGVQNRDETKLVLQTLLASRVNSDKIIAVSTVAEADAIVTGTYIVIGKVYSMDALAKTSAGKTVTRTFIQGDSQDELIMTVGKLAEKLNTELTRAYATLLATPVVEPQYVPPTSTNIIRTQSNIREPQSGNIIRPQEFMKGSSGGWISKRLPGAANLLAMGETLKSGEREIFLAQGNRVEYFRQGDVLKRIAGINFKANEKIIALDSIDADGDGKQELYISIVRGDDLASQVWEVKGDKLALIADEQPYFFRSIALAGGVKKLYAQEMGRDEDYYGDVHEAVRSGKSIKLKNPIKLPRYGNIYSFNQFKDKDGNLLTIVVNPDNYLVVFDQDKKEIWRSNEYFGGTALFYEKDDSVNVRTTGSKYRWVFLNQRIIVTSKGDIMVGKNEGLFVIGNVRLYKKGAVYCFGWDGSSLEEKWRTKETQSYMPDFWYDEPKNELLILQMPQKPGPGEDGAASLAIKKVE